MSVGAWRQRLRLLEGLRLLAAGSSVTEVAMEVGYSTSSAFGAMFVRETGTTPARYFRESSATSPR
jgi:AraC-like DNA-binding protein